jgi:hypothetical protein
LFSSQALREKTNEEKSTVPVGFNSPTLILPATTTDVERKDDLTKEEENRVGEKTEMKDEEGLPAKMEEATTAEV